MKEPRLYHGSPYQVAELRPPSETGVIRNSEAGRSHHRDMVFLTTSLHMALDYAGPEGYLYVVEAPDAEIYTQAGKKHPQTNEDVYIARSARINLRLHLAPRKRGQEQAFFLDN